MINNNFDGIMRGPAIITGIRNDILINNKDTPILQRVIKILEKEKYSLSPRQRKILDQSASKFDEHRKACLEAKKIEETEFKKMLAQTFQCDVEDIVEVKFHEASITTSLNHSAFQSEWQKTCDEEGVEISEVMSAAGLTSERLNIRITNSTLPISLEDVALKKDGEIPEHENLHTQYRYLHPRDKSEKILTPLEYRSELTDKSKTLTENRDIEGFKNLVKEVAGDQLSVYLNELSSAALEKDINILSQAFGENNHLYNVVFKKKIQAIKQSLPTDIKERLYWEKIIFEEIKKAESKANYINEEYKKLAQTDIDGKELASIVEFLSPDQGFLVKAFVGVNKPTMADIKQWKKEYEHPQINDKKDQTNFYSNFLIETALISNDEYDPIKKSIDKIVAKRRSEVFDIAFSRITGKKPEDFKDNNWLGDIEIQVQQMKTIFLARALRLQLLFNSGFLDGPEMIQNKNAIIQEAIKKSVDFNYQFLQSISEVIGFRTDMDKKYMSDRATILKRSFALDDAAEDLVEVLGQKQHPDYDSLFSKDYKKTNDKRERIRQRYYNLGLEDHPGQSPLEDEAVLLFNNIMNNSSDENFVFQADKKQFQRLCSSCIRVLLWSNESGKPLKDFGSIRMFIYNMYKMRILPMEYDDLVKDGTLGIDPNLEISVKEV